MKNQLVHLRLTEKDLERVAALQEVYGEISMAATIRGAISLAFHVDVVEREKKMQKKSQKTA